MPVIDKPAFLRQYNKMMDNRNDHVFARSETAFLSLLFAVFSCAAPLVQDARLATGERADDGGMGMVYYERYVPSVEISSSCLPLSPLQCSHFTIYQPRKHSNRPCPMLPPSIVFPLLYKLLTPGMDSNRSGGPYWSGPWASRKIIYLVLI